MNSIHLLVIDLRFALRQLRKSPGFTTVAVMILALGIGATTAIFSVMDAVLLQPLPFSEPQQLVQMDETWPDGHPNGSVTGGAFLDWRTHNRTMEQVAISGWVGFNLTGTDQPERVRGLQVTADYLRVLRIDPIVGRGFTVDEDKPGNDHRVVLLNHTYWKSRFGGKPEIIGTQISLDQNPYTIIGVLPPDRIMENGISLLVPLTIDLQAKKWRYDGHWGKAIGRLKSGISVAQAQAEWRSIRDQTKSNYPAYKEKWGVALTPLQERIFPSKAQPTLVILLGAVALVLLIACANIANLLLARGNARHKEMAVRVALGASRWGIIRLVLIESLLLAFLGGSLGVLIAAGGVDLPAGTVVGLFPEMRHPELNFQMLLFSLGLACGCGLLFGILPALKIGKTDFNTELKEGGRSGTSGSRARSQSLLMVSEVTLTVMLLIGAGLFLRSFLHVLDVDPGFHPEKTLAFDLSFPDTKYPKAEDRLRFIKDLNVRIGRLPGVESTAAVSGLPLSDTGWTETVSRTDRPAPNINDLQQRYIAGCDYVTGDYFSAAGITLLRGRPVRETDNLPGSPRVMVIDSKMARDLYPDENPIGQSIRLLGKSWEIVGIAAPIRHSTLDADPQARVYVAQIHNPISTSMIVRTAVPPLTLIDAVRKTIRSADPDQPIHNIRTLEQAIDQTMAKERMTLSLLGIFAIVAVGLACLGLYGFLSYFVGQRTREMGIRSALGAQRQDIVKQVVFVGMKLSLTGIAIGGVGALALARLVESQLFGITAYDPPVYLVSIGMIGFVALLSAYLPALRAARVDPMVALRHE